MPRLEYLDPETLQKLDSLELAARQVVEGIRIGLHKSPLRGYSTEFSHHRPYVAGDALRHVDWRVYARTSRYYVKLYESETDFTANLLLDASSSMHYGSGSVTKLEYAKFLAASLAHLIVTQRDRVGLGVFDGSLRSHIEPSSTQSIVETIARELREVQPVPRTNVAGILHDFARRMSRRGFVILFSDLLDHVEEFGRGLDHLRYRGHNVIVFHILDSDELRFPFDGTRKFKGLEDQSEIITRPRRIREAYLQELDVFLSSVKRTCERNLADYCLVDTSRPVDTVLTGFLLERLRSLI